jgi:hypothetical protein
MLERPSRLVTQRSMRFSEQPAIFRAEDVSTGII